MIFDWRNRTSPSTFSSEEGSLSRKRLVFYFTASSTDLNSNFTVSTTSRRRERGRYVLGIIDEDSLRQKEGTFLLSHLNYLKDGGRTEVIKKEVIGMKAHTHIYTQRSPDTDLVYVLAEGWNGGELTDQVEVGGGKGVHGTSVKDGQSLVGGQGQVLDGNRWFYLFLFNEPHLSVTTLNVSLTQVKATCFMLPARRVPGE